jgi:hypothetical protein
MLTVSQSEARRFNHSIEVSSFRFAVRTLLIVLTAGLVFCDSQGAFASCGDYLHHRADNMVLDVSVGVQGRLSKNSHGLPQPVPSPRCSNGSCRGELPTPAPTDGKVRIERSRHDFQLVSCVVENGDSVGYAVVSSWILPSNPFLEVAVPPPRS